MKKGPFNPPRAYLAGPMTGYEEHNFPAFTSHAAWLRQHGYEVVNPAELEALETGPRKEWAYYLKRDIRELLTCNCIAVMRGWENSPGATLEVYIGWRLGFSIFAAEDFTTLDVSKFDFSGIQNETNSGAFLRSFTMRKMDRPVEFSKEVTPREYLFPLKGEPDDYDFQKIHKSNKAGETFRAPEATISKPENILKEADKIVGGDRNADYGGPRQDFDRTAAIWGAILGIKNITAMQVALCMIGVKMSRQCNKIKRDNLVDIAGYARCAEMVADSYEVDAGKDVQ